MDLLSTAFEVASEIKMADVQIEHTTIGDETTIEIPAIDVGFVRLKGGKHVKIVGLVLQRTK